MPQQERADRPKNIPVFLDQWLELPREPEYFKIVGVHIRSIKSISGGFFFVKSFPVILGIPSIENHSLENRKIRDSYEKRHEIVDYT